MCSMIRNAAHSRFGRPTAGFTLIEIIVVITIVAILASLGLIVGKKVTEGSRSDATRNLIKNLEATQSGFAADKDAPIPWKYVDESSQKNEFAIADARQNASSTTSPAEPSLALYLLATASAPSVESAIGKIDAKFITRAQFAGNYASKGPTDLGRFYVNGALAPRDKSDNVLSAITVKDPWGNPLRFVHPKFAGGYGSFYRANGSGGYVSVTNRPDLNADGKIKLRQNGADYAPTFRRSFRPFDPSSASTSEYGDADEGLTTGNFGYFYSPGPDNNPGTRSDNVYSNTPRFPSETDQKE